MNNYWTLLRFCGWMVFEEAMFLLKAPRRRFFLLRIVISIGVIMGGTALVTFLWSLVPSWPMGVWAMQFFFYWMITLAGVMICFDIKLKELLFIGTGAYALQHIGVSMVTIIKYALTSNGVSIDGIGYEIFFNYMIYVVIGVIAYFIVIRPNENKKLLLDKDIKQILIALIFFIACVYLNGIANSTDQFVSRLVCRSYAIICSVLVLIIQFALGNKNRLQQEKDEMNRLFQMEKEQQELSTKTIDIINMKCHDIRHLISGLEDINDGDERKKYIDELKKEIKIYDKVTKTGNEALDIVLMEKSLLCDNYEIKFSYMADGENLKFISALDTYILFGNALDNAIESVCQEMIPEKRTISLKVAMHGEMLHIHIENHCPKPVEFDESGIPVTTKADKDYHGYGLKSIKFIADKYNGEMRTVFSEEKFILDMLFALKQPI